jgi:hypothetical protein
MMGTDLYSRHDSLNQCIMELNTCLDSQYIERPPVLVSANSPSSQGLITYHVTAAESANAPS